MTLIRKYAEDHIKADLDGIRKELKEVEPAVAVRIVNLQYKACCGCGCSLVNVKRTVPVDSDLKDGDIIKEVLDDDIW